MAQPLKANVDGVTLYIDVEPEADDEGGLESFGLERTGAPKLNRALEETQDALENAKNTITGMAKTLVGAIKTFDSTLTPDEFSLEFGIKFNAEGSALIAKVGTEATLKITMKYVHVKEPAKKVGSK
ncbi:MAG: CU044_2847 family protein [Chloroflexota bacterium]|nr:hypothetical protein [Chloroflexota bacterium]